MTIRQGENIIAGNNKVIGASWEIGDIGIAALGIDETKNKRRYLNGQVISQTQFGEFATKIKNAIALYPALSATEVNWQAEVTNSDLGQCGKFVVDDVAGTIRLPKVVNINGLQDLTVLGGIKDESLPNIKGTTKHSYNDYGGAEQQGAFYPNAQPISGLNMQGGTTGGTFRTLGFDASLSSSTYQDNAPVQQEAVQYPYFIQVATGVEEDVNISTEIQLNNPFSLLDYKYSEYELNNASWLRSNGQYNSGATYQAVYNLLLAIYNGTKTKTGVSVKLSTETYADTDFVLNTGDTTFRLPTKVLMAGSKRIVGNGMTLGLTNGSTNYGLTSTNSQYFGGIDSSYGTNLPSSRTSGSFTGTAANIGITTDETKSGIETSINGLYLYFYVGETVQDANVIATGQVLTDIANLKTHYVTETYINGTSWYRVYSDGWCEQGGHVAAIATSMVETVYLIHSFTDTKYKVLKSWYAKGTAYTGASYDATASVYTANDKTTASFRTYNLSGWDGFDWQACGYIS